MGENTSRFSAPELPIQGMALRAAGYTAAAALCAVSITANLRFGLSLGNNPLDKFIYATASMAADIFKISLPLIALHHWAARYRAYALASLCLWLGCVGWSFSSAVGFALTSRAEVVAEREIAADRRNGWEATVHRAETKLSALGVHQPVSVIQAELSSASVPPQIWLRTKRCTDVTVSESREACAEVARLRRERAAAEAAERLERDLVAGRDKLAALPVTSQRADPQAGALASLLGLDAATIRTGLALLLAGLVEAGSALGFTLVAVATTAKAVNPDPKRRHGPKPDAPRRLTPPQPGTIAETIRRWALTRLDIDPAAAIPARTAYEDFCCRQQAHDGETCTETRFGILFTALIGELGGHKVKRRDRAYYVGVALTETSMPVREIARASVCEDDK